MHMPIYYDFAQGNTFLPCRIATDKSNAKEIDALFSDTIDRLASGGEL